MSNETDFIRIGMSLGDILLAALTGALALIVWFAKDNFKVIRDEVRGNRDEINQLKNDFISFKQSVAEGKVGDVKELNSELEKAEDALNELQKRILTDNVTKHECSALVNDIKERIRKVEESLSEVDRVTREQGLLLNRIDGILQSLVEG